MCGVDVKLGDTPVGRIGLSPRVRGRYVIHERLPVAAPVYPRAYGVDLGVVEVTYSYRGLSPHVRGRFCEIVQ